MAKIHPRHCSSSSRSSIWASLITLTLLFNVIYPSSSVLNLRNIVIVTIFMSLLFCISPTDWFFSALWDIFFCFFFSCQSLVWFQTLWFFLTLLDTRYFCFPESILELCSGTQLNYLKTAWFFWVLFSGFVRWDQSGLWPSTNYSPLLRQTFLTLLLHQEAGAREFHWEYAGDYLLIRHKPPHGGGRLLLGLMSSDSGKVKTLRPFWWKL